MSTIDVLWLAYLNRNIDDAGSDNTINLTINVDGEDVLDRNFGSNFGDGEAYLNGGSQLDTPFDSATLTNSSVRIGVRGDDAWAPGDILVFGHSLAEFQSGVAVPLAIETGLTDFLSTDPSEGPLTVPLRRVDPGTSNTVIRRVLLLVHTQWSGGDCFREGTPARTAPSNSRFSPGRTSFCAKRSTTPPSPTSRGARRTGTSWTRSCRSPAARCRRAAGSCSASSATTRGSRSCCSSSGWTPPADGRTRWCPWSRDRSGGRGG